MIQSSLEPRMAKLKIDPFTRRKNIRHIADIIRGVDIVDGYTTVPLNAFYAPDHSVFGSQYPNIGGLTTTFRK